MTEKYLRKSSKEIFWSFFWFGIPYFIWMYSIINELTKKTSNYGRISRVILKILISYLIIYFPTAITILITSAFTKMGSIFPFHMLATSCIIFLMLLTCVTIIKFEQSEKLKKSNEIGLFFGIWFFIFGVWYIQPKLNEYVKRIK